MNILQVISYFYPAWDYGGPGKLVYELSIQLGDNGHDIMVYSTDAFNHERRRNENDNIFVKSDKFKAIFFRNISNFLAYKYKFFLPLPNSLLDINKIKSFDIIHIHEFFTPLALIISYYANLYHIPYIISAHGTLDTFHLSHRRTVKSLFMKLFGKKIISHAAKLIAATQDEVNEYKSLGISAGKIVYITNGIDITDFNKMPKRELWRKKYNLTAKTLILVYLGRIHKLKGLDMLVKAFVSISPSTDTRLVIAGSDDGYLTELKTLADSLSVSDKIIFPGVIYGEEKRKMFRDSDVFVYPSPSEGFSIANLEAGAAGLPLVITEGCKFPQVEKHKAGIIVKAEDVSIRQAIINILQNDAFREQAGRNARKMVEKNFTIAVMAEKLAKVYKEVINNYV